MTAADQGADRDKLTEALDVAFPLSDFRAGSATWFRLNEMGLAKLADAILNSDWLAALIEREHGKAVAPILALADKYRQHGKDGAGAEWFVIAREIRAACDPAAATTHQRAVAAQTVTAERERIATAIEREAEGSEGWEHGAMMDAARIARAGGNQ